MARKDTGPSSLILGVAQMALAGELAQNRDKIIRFISQAKAVGCRVVVFPESALISPPGTPRARVDDAVDAIRDAAWHSDVYVILCTVYERTGSERPVNALLVIDPTGQVVLTYHKLFDLQPNRVPGVFPIDGVPCSAIICADRWIRGVEDLPAMQGSSILFECSNNYADEWVANLGWYWYVPRALRNGAYVVLANTAANPEHERFEHLYAAHGHSAVVAPDGQLVVAADEAEQLLVTTVHLDRTVGVEAARRRSHPLLKPFWDVGLSLLRGDEVAVPSFEGHPSPSTNVTVAAAQLACARRVDDNVNQMCAMIRTARANGADVVVFPELAVTGADAEDVQRVTVARLRGALASIQAAARAEGIAVVFGMPDLAGDRRRNCAFVLGPDGQLLTRYAQIVVDRPALFVPGTSTRATWFRLHGVPAVVTVGRREALWNELAELAAIRGAQLHLHLEYDTDATPEGALLRRQLWITMASYRTFTATVNAGATDGLLQPSVPAAGGSVLWEDFRRQRGRGAYPYCAIPLVEAGAGQEIIYATCTVETRNAHYDRMVGHYNPQMKAWYDMGARVIDEG
jgi:predicted amidohydrolase